MAITWGATTLKVLVDTWRPGISSRIINEVALIPDSTDLTAIATVIQQGGKSRKKVQCKLHVTSMTAYNAFVTAYIAGTSATLADGDTLNATYMIEFIGEPEYKLASVIFFDITFLEV